MPKRPAARLIDSLLQGLRWCVSARVLGTLCAFAWGWAASTPHAAQPVTFDGLVVRVVDGDTFDVAVTAGGRRRIRIGGIDAPEMDQPYGRLSATHLRRLALRRPVTVQAIKRDQNGRWIGHAWIAAPEDCPEALGRCPRRLDLGLAQVSAGLAWHYKHYASEQTPGTRTRYASEEREARARRAGVWATRGPMPPWEWRQRRSR